VTRQRWLLVLRLLLAVLIAAAVIAAVAGRWDDVRTNLGRVTGGGLLLSAAFAGLGLVFTLVGWRALLADLGSPLALRPAAGVLFIGQLGKYLPGSVWAVVVQTDLAAKLGVPRKRSALAGLVAVAMSALAGLGLGLVALPGLVHADAGYAVVAVLVPVGVFCLQPRILSWGMGIVLRLTRRPPLTQQLSPRAVVVAMGAFGLAWCCLGLHVWVLAVDVGAPARDALVAAVFGYPLASALGMAAVVLPAGAGVRELVLVLLLTGPLDGSAALAVAIVSRFMIVLGDIAAAVLGWAYSRRASEIERPPP
jgi:glycosyltransferase 2 family protein